MDLPVNPRFYLSTNAKFIDSKFGTMQWFSMGQKCHDFTFNIKGIKNQIVFTDKDISIEFSRKCDCGYNW